MREGNPEQYPQSRPDLFNERSRPDQPQSRPTDGANRAERGPLEHQQSRPDSFDERTTPDKSQSKPTDKQETREGQEQQTKADRANRAERMSLEYSQSRPDSFDERSGRDQPQSKLGDKQETREAQAQQTTADRANHAERRSLEYPQSRPDLFNESSGRDQQSKLPDAKEELVSASDTVPPEFEARDAASEARERQRVYHPEDGVGFEYGSSRLSPEAQARIKEFRQRNPTEWNNPDAVLRITGSASRPGNSIGNFKLSEGRVNGVEKQVRKEGFKGKVDVIPEGAYPAEESGVPANYDRAEDRVAKLEFVSLDYSPPEPDEAELGTRVKDAERAAEEMAKTEGKNLGELPPLPRETSPVVKGLTGVEAALRTAEIVVESAALEGSSGVLSLGLAAYENWEARTEWMEASQKALEMAGVLLSMKTVGADATSPNNPHIQEGKLYTGGELFKSIQDRRPGAWAGWAFEEAGAGDTALEHMNRGLSAAADMTNTLLSRFNTPAERQAALSAFSSTIEKRIEDSMRQRGVQVKGRKGH